MLHVVNGACAARALKMADIPGEYLPWDDLLYEGPVPIPEPLGRLNQIRAKFVTEAGWSNFADAIQRFEHRNRVLENHANRDKVILWNSFELTDQLQLLQLLHWFSMRTDQTGRIRIVFVDDYLAENATTLVQKHWGTQQVVGATRISTAANFWTAFCAKTPMDLYQLTRSDQYALEFPFLDEALERLFQEFPAIGDGLSQTQRQILLALRDEPKTPAGIFQFSQAREARRFIGDWSVWRLLEDMARAATPLIKPVHGSWIPDLSLKVDSQAEFYTRRIELTSAGRSVLSGRADAIELNGIDRWIGGTHLIPGAVWRWCGDRKKFVRTAR